MRRALSAAFEPANTGTLSRTRTLLRLHPQRIPRATRPCFSGDIHAGRAACLFSTSTVSRRATWRKGARTDMDEVTAMNDILGGNKEEQTTFTPSNPPMDDEELRSSLGPIDRQYAPQTDVPNRIHIIGLGAIGKLVAHSLRSVANPPPVTLILHNYHTFKEWEKSSRRITIRDGAFSVPVGGFDVELARSVKRVYDVPIKGSPDEFYTYAREQGLKPREAAQKLDQARKRSEEEGLKPDLEDYSAHPAAHAISDEPIHNLIIATKSIFLLNALTGLKHRLSRDSTICFLQNGMGFIEDINTHVFPDEATRPNYVQGIVTHGVNIPLAQRRQDPFSANHAGHGTIALGLVPRQSFADRATGSVTPTGAGTENEGKLDTRDTDELAPTARYLVRTLTRCPVLCAVAFTPIELFQQQLEKLAVNCAINPLTVLLDSRNGALLYNYPLTRTMRLLLAEISLVIRSLPELKGIPNIPFRFSPERLETLVVGVAYKTANNISSMLADVRSGGKTEIDFINGYIVKRGEEMGIKCVVNYAIMQTVIGKSLMAQREKDDEVPYELQQRDRGAQ